MTTTYINYDDYKKVEMRIGRIISAQPVEKSEKLLLLSVDFGEETPRTVVSGIAKYFPDPATLEGVRCGFVANLEPRPLMGHESQAMILATGDDETFSLLRVSDDVPPGSLVR